MSKASNPRLQAFSLALVLAAAALVQTGCERAEYRALPGDTIRSGWTAVERPSEIALPPAQREFLDVAAQASLFDIEASRIALARGGSAAVRRFASATLRDRVATDTDLQQLASSVGVALPSYLSSEQQARLAVLAQLTGADFDRAYARNVGLVSQEETLAASERAADRNGERVQRFAADQIPELRKHLEQGRKLAADLERSSMA